MAQSIKKQLTENWEEIANIEPNQSYLIENITPLRYPASIRFGSAPDAGVHTLKAGEALPNLGLSGKIYAKNKDPKFSAVLTVTA